MLNDFIASVIERELTFAPTASQKQAIAELARFIADTDSNNGIFILRGYAGTGKTSLMQALVAGLEKLKHSVVLLAPTGRAAKVISYYTQRPAFTIHKRIYRQRSLAQSFGRFDLDVNMLANAVFIVDEASMIADNSPDGKVFGSGSLLDDLMSFVYNRRNCKLVLVGDTAQLPPVGLSVSPALDRDILARGFLKEVYEAELDQVMRQSEDSGILFNATIIRRLIAEGQPAKLKLDIARFPDIVRVSGEDLPDAIAKSYSDCGIGDTILITRSNKRANQFNEGIRQSVQWKDSEIGSGDYVMIAKNNYQGFDDVEGVTFIANGDIAEVRSVTNFQELFGFRFADAVLRFPDYGDVEIKKKIILDTLHTESPALSAEQNKALFYEVEKDYADEHNKKKRYEKIRTDPYFSALQIKFAYAITGHKSQGGQWKHVYLDHGYLPEPEMDVDMLRWMYTAFTRARHKLFLVNFKSDFFNE